MRLRNQYEMDLIRKSGKIASAALKKSLEAVKAGVSELEIDKIAEKAIYALSGDLSYKTVPNYKYATCITVNDAVVHGIPTDRKFVTGDIVSIDLAVVYKGWHTDTAWTILIGQDPQKERFLQIGKEALWNGIAQAIDGKRIGDISAAIQNKIEDAGFHIVRSLVGHGIGRSLHEDPQIPGYGRSGTGAVLKSGMTLAIEVIYTRGTSEVVLGADNWTYSSADGSWGGLFEMTVIVGKKQAEVLTAMGL